MIARARVVVEPGLPEFLTDRAVACADDGGRGRPHIRPPSGVTGPSASAPEISPSRGKTGDLPEPR